MKTTWRKHHENLRITGSGEVLYNEVQGKTEKEMGLSLTTSGFSRGRRCGGGKESRRRQEQKLGATCGPWQGAIATNRVGRLLTLIPGSADARLVDRFRSNVHQRGHDRRTQTRQRGHRRILREACHQGLRLSSGMTLQSHGPVGVVHLGTDVSH